MTKGTVKFYNVQKGFGFIEPEDGGKDVFVHATALERAGISRLVEGQKVSLTPAGQPQRQDRGRQAPGRVVLNRTNADLVNKSRSLRERLCWFSGDGTLAQLSC